jgi:hypothetical protein
MLETYFKILLKIRSRLLRFIYLSSLSWYIYLCSTGTMKHSTSYNQNGSFSFIGTSPSLLDIYPKYPGSPVVALPKKRFAFLRFQQNICFFSYYFIIIIKRACAENFFFYNYKKSRWRDCNLSFMGSMVFIYN